MEASMVFALLFALPFTGTTSKKETTTSLLLYPFCFMDANSFYEQRYTPQQTYAD